MSLYNFIILRKKGDSSTGVFLWNLWNFGGCFSNQVIYYYAIKNYVGQKLAILNAVLFTLWHLLLTRWWDMRLKHDGTWLWQTAEICAETKRIIAHAVLHRWEMIPFYQRTSIISKICFSEIGSPSCVIKRTYFGNFTRPKTYFGRSKPSGEC